MKYFPDMFWARTKQAPVPAPIPAQRITCKVSLDGGKTWVAATVMLSSLSCDVYQGTNKPVKVQFG
jgi:hypothetical protein